MLAIQPARQTKKKEMERNLENHLAITPLEYQYRYYVGGCG